MKPPINKNAPPPMKQSVLIHTGNKKENTPPPMKQCVPINTGYKQECSTSYKTKCLCKEKKEDRLLFFIFFS